MTPRRGRWAYLPPDLDIHRISSLSCTLHCQKATQRPFCGVKPYDALSATHYTTGATPVAALRYTQCAFLHIFNTPFCHCGVFVQSESAHCSIVGVFVSGLETKRGCTARRLFRLRTTIAATPIAL
jgi:hypothetical protein